MSTLRSMRIVGTTRGWVFFEHAGRVVAVDPRVMDVTSAMPASVTASAGLVAWEADPITAEVARSLAVEVLLEGASSAVASVTASTSARRADRALLPARAGAMDIPRVRILHRALLASSDTGGLSADDRDAALVWARDLLAQHDAAALTAAAPEGGEPELDPDAPHRFQPTDQIHDMCLYCGRAPDEAPHSPDAPDYEILGMDPQAPHFFYMSDDDEDVCAVCGGGVDTEQHHAADVAAYAVAKDAYDSMLDLYNQRHFPEGEDAVVSAVEALGVDWETDEDPDEAELLERDLMIEDEVDAAYWDRYAHEDADPLTYYMVHDPDDTLVALVLYASDGSDWYRWDPWARGWLAGAPDADAAILAVDDDTAYEVMRASAHSSGRPVDIRDIHPSEAYLMQDGAARLDDDMLMRVVVAAAGDEQYTPQERAKNAQQQVRDRFGRFAKGGSRVTMGDGREGRITKIDPTRQSVTVRTDDGEESEVDAASIEVTGPGRGRQRVDPDKVQGIPRVTDTTPKAWLDKLLPPLDAGAVNAMVENYPAYVEKERALKRPGLSAAAPKDAQGFTDPEQSDVTPIYMAVVDEDDHDAVLDLISLIPAGPHSTEPMVMRRTENGWEKDVSMLRALKSVTPPPVVVLSEEDKDSVLAQVDEHYATDGESTMEAERERVEGDSSEAAVALPSLYGPNGEILTAGGVPGVADTPEDHAAAARLKRYWTVGEGGAKIAWNTPGDFTRCDRHLSKYLGGRAEGYCAILHHDVTGVWPGDRRNVGKRGRALRASGGESAQLRSTASIIALTAAAAEACGEPPVQRVTEVPSGGSPFIIKILVPVGTPSGDGRRISPLALTHRDLPLPLMWQMRTQDGHDASVIVGRIDSVERMSDGSLGNARGVFDTGVWGTEAERLVRHNFLRGVSVDLDNFEAVTSTPKKDTDGSEASTDMVIKSDDTLIKKARVMGATLVAKPAFQECIIQIESEEDAVVADGTYIGYTGDEAEITAAVVAAGIPVNPPESWFKDPGLSRPTPLTVEDDGRVYGHIATWEVDHIGLPFATKPPRSRSNYAYFHTGALRTAEGGDVPVGQITLSGGHAPLHADANAAVRHYDDTASAVCDVHAGEDAHGIWVAGALRPSVSAEQVRSMRAAAPSGDWRPINGRLELVAVCQVNVPGFPVTRARVASGHIMSLVAAGAVGLARMQAERSGDYEALATRVASLEESQRMELSRMRDAAVSRFDSARSEVLAARARSARERMEALRSTGTDRELAQRVGEARKRFAMLAAGVYPNGEPWDPNNHPRDDRGRFRDVLARLKRDLEQEAGTAEAVSAIEEAQASERMGDLEEARVAADKVLDLVDDIAANTVNGDTVATLREGYSNLGDAVANMPLPIGDFNTKMSYSDLPQDLQSLVEDLLDRVETRLGHEEAAKATTQLRSFMSGGDLLSQPEISGELSRLLRYLI